MIVLGRPWEKESASQVGREAVSSVTDQNMQRRLCVNYSYKDTWLEEVLSLVMYTQGCRWCPNHYGQAAGSHQGQPWVVLSRAGNAPIPKWILFCCESQKS